MVDLVWQILFGGSGLVGSIHQAWFEGFNLVSLVGDLRFVTFGLEGMV